MSTPAPGAGQCRPGAATGEPAGQCYPSPVPVGGTVVDYLMTRRESLLDALNILLAGQASTRVAAHGLHPTDGTISALLGVTADAPLIHRAELIVEQRPGREHHYGMVISEIVGHRLPAALRHHLETEPGPWEAALRRHSPAGAVHRALIGHTRPRSGMHAYRCFLLGDEDGPIAHSVEMLWSQGGRPTPTVVDLAEGPACGRAALSAAS